MIIKFETEQNQWRLNIRCDDQIILWGLVGQQ
jgi:hypothetical protein